MTTEMEARFVDEINGMTRRGLRLYERTVADELVRAILRTLSIEEKKWLYLKVHRKRKEKNIWNLCYYFIGRIYIRAWKLLRRDRAPVDPR